MKVVHLNSIKHSASNRSCKALLHSEVTFKSMTLIKNISSTMNQSHSINFCTWHNCPIKNRINCAYCLTLYKDPPRFLVTWLDGLDNPKILIHFFVLNFCSSLIFVIYMYIVSKNKYKLKLFLRCTHFKKLRRHPGIQQK